MAGSFFPVSLQSAIEPVKVACVGDSITAGVGAGSSFSSYPSQLQRMLGPEWLVKNFGSSGSTLLRNGDQPYQKTAALTQALAFNPQVVVIMLGTNDSKPQNWKFKDEFASDYKDLISQFRELKSNPRIVLCTAPFVGKDALTSINEPVVLEQLPVVADVAKQEGLDMIDNHKATNGKREVFPDGVHPNAAGATILAKSVYEGLTGKLYTGDVPSTYDSRWQGYKMQEFEVAQRLCKIVFPENPLPGNPWIWRTEFFGAFPSVDVALTAAGYHVAYMDVSGMFGSPKALDLMDIFYDHMVSNYQMNSKAVLEGFSRGGLFALNWARRHPERISSIYLDAPVCDFKSWPGGKGKGKGSLKDWEGCLKVYGLTEEEAMTYPGNPSDNLKLLAEAKIPIVCVYGDADLTVVPEENILVVEKRYKEMGGEITLIAKPGVDHHPHSLEDPKPVVDFIHSHQKH